MTQLSWAQFDKNQEAKDISFESFCFQTAHLLYSHFGAFENFYNTPGSEFYLKLFKDCEKLNLKRNDEVGWQVKWWFNNEDSTSLFKKRRDELVKGFKTTLKRHPDIKLWIICTPGSFTEDTFSKLKNELKKLSNSTHFIHWNKEKFKNFLAENPSKFSPIFAHYFSNKFIGFHDIQKYTKRRLEDLNKKFDTDLYSPSHYDDEIFQIIQHQSIFSKLKSQADYFDDEVNRIESDNNFKIVEHEQLSNEYTNSAYELLHLIVNFSKQIISGIREEMSVELADRWLTEIEKFFVKYSRLADSLNKMLKDDSYLKSPDVELSHHTDYFHNYLIGSINELRSYISSRNDQKDKKDGIKDLLELVFRNDIHVLSNAGHGKTNIACNICKTCLEKNIPSLLILGSAFRKPELPQKIITELLSIDHDYTFKELLNALNNLGFLKNVKVPIIIDGLNESTPFDLIWHNNIKDIINDVNEFKNIILITTCRDRYIKRIFEVDDIKSIPNTLFLSGLAKNQRDSAIKKYFSKYKINPSSWNFDKELFRNPLLLRIFSEVNQETRGLSVSKSNVFSSIEKYIEKISKSASIKNASVDPILFGKTTQKIELFSKWLWEKGKRQISLSQFHEIIAPSNESLSGSLTERLLDEGLCFQKNLDSNEETVQFTYDLVAGFSIAKFLVNSIAPEDNLNNELKRLKIPEQLFDLKTFHPLSQDIIMSLMYLFPLRFDVYLFETFSNETLIEECINNIDLLANDKNGQKKLLNKINAIDKSSRIYRLLFEKLFEKIFKKKIHDLSQFTLKCLSSLNQAEIDYYWTEVVRNGSENAYELVNETSKKYLKNNYNKDGFLNDFYSNLLLTSSSSRELRGLATENLFLIAYEFPNEFLIEAENIIEIKDIGMHESIVVAISGSALSLRKEAFAKSCLTFFSEKYLPNSFNYHINICEYILTLSEFAETHYGIEQLKLETFIDVDFKIEKAKKTNTKKSFSSDYYGYHCGVDLSDFVEHQIKAIASDSYRNNETFTISECLEILKQRVHKKGYDEQNFEKIEYEIINARGSVYGREENKKLCTYFEKYLWHSYFEFVGYMVFMGLLKSDDGCRYRCYYDFFDPTFPRRPGKFQIINDCFFPNRKEDVQDWINSKNDNFINNFHRHHLMTENQWVLLSLYISQKSQNVDILFNLFVRSYLIDSQNASRFKNEVLEEGYSENSFTRIYAGEINWSNRLLNPESNYYQAEYNSTETTLSYGWQEWTFNRFAHPSFRFLHPIISNALELKFNSKELAFYNKDGEQVTKMLWTENSQLYYMREDALNSCLSKLKLNFIWYQFSEKFADYDKDWDKRLDILYNKSHKITDYQPKKA